MTKKSTKLLVLLIIILLCFVLFKIIKVQDIVLKKIIYPTKYSEYVEKYSKENNLDKYMIYSIIKAESNFNPKVKSSHNAIGLMQLLVSTANEVVENNENEYITEENLYNEEINIKLGTMYYSYLLKHYSGNNVLALAAYNAGIGTVDTWINSGVINSNGTDIENIPYMETNTYVRKILKNYQMYLKLYN